MPILSATVSSPLLRELPCAQRAAVRRNEVSQATIAADFPESLDLDQNQFGACRNSSSAAPIRSLRTAASHGDNSDLASQARRFDLDQSYQPIAISTMRLGIVPGRARSGR
jgi:hypothetical protein